MMEVTDEMVIKAVHAYQDEEIRVFGEVRKPNNGARHGAMRTALEAALSHAAGQDGEQCRAASGDREALATRLRELICEYWDLAYDEGVDKRNSDTPAGDANRVANEIETIIRALSRGVPEDTKDAQRFRDLCELVQAGEWALCEVEITDKYGTVKENWQDGLSDIPQFCDTWASRAASWRKVRTESEQKAAIAAQRKEG